MFVDTLKMQKKYSLLQMKFYVWWTVHVVLLDGSVELICHGLFLENYHSQHVVLDFLSVSPSNSCSGLIILRF